MATDSNDNIASFSSNGSGLALSAPGVSILTWNPAAGDTGLAYWSGTSFASPLVAGVTALMLSVNPALTPAQVTGDLEQTALDLGTTGWDSFFGYGRVQADAAVAAAAGGSSTTTTTAPPTTTTSSSTTTTSSSTTTTSLPTTTTTIPGGTTRYEETSSLLTYTGAWMAKTSAGCSSGALDYTYFSGSSVTATFTGTELTWLAGTGPGYGKARVTLDEGTPILVDLYSSSYLNQQQVWTTGTLASGTHTVRIEWAGQKNPASSCYYVTVDAFDIVGTLTSTGSLGVGGQI